jgi:hypothetical protein
MIAHHIENSNNGSLGSTEQINNNRTYAAEEDKRSWAIRTSRHTQDSETRVRSELRSVSTAQLLTVHVRSQLNGRELQRNGACHERGLYSRAEGCTVVR